MPERERRHRVTSSHSRKTRRPSDIVMSCGGPEPRDGRRRRGTRQDRGGRRRGQRKRKKTPKESNPRYGKRVYTRAERRKKNLERVGSGDADPGHQENIDRKNIKEAERGAQCKVRYSGLDKREQTPLCCV